LAFIGKGFPLERSFQRFINLMHCSGTHLRFGFSFFEGRKTKAAT